MLLYRHNLVTQFCYEGKCILHYLTPPSEVHLHLFELTLKTYDRTESIFRQNEIYEQYKGEEQMTATGDVQCVVV